MSSWFGSGLSQLTGQISNFTKEVLEEGTEEIDDHVTQLKIAKQHLVELNSHCHSQRSELERLQAINEDLQDKLESSELQINAISNEYREIVERKEEEIKKFRREQTSLNSTQALVDVAPSTSPPGSVLSHSSSAPALHKGFHGDDQDFDDIISSQYEINRLRNENQRLDLECRHWKQVSQSNQTIPGGAGQELDQIVTLQTQLKELREQYDSEIDQHQRELAALQDVHQQKLSTLKKKHKEQVGEIQQQLAQQTQHVTASIGGSVVQKQLQDKIDHLESINSKVTVDLELTHAADREKARRLQELQQQLRSLQDSSQQLSQQQEALVKENSELMEQLDSVVSEHRTLKNHMGELNQKQREKHEAQTSQGTPSPGRSTTSHSELDHQIQTLQTQVTCYKGEIDQFDLVKYDWLMEKEALEDVLLKLREQLREKEEELVATQNTQVQKQDVADTDAETAALNHKVDLLTHSTADLETERDSLLLEKEKLEKELAHQKLTPSNQINRPEPQQEEIQTMKEKETAIEDLRQQLNEKEQLLGSLMQDRDDADDLASQVDDLHKKLKMTEEFNKTLSLELDESKAELESIILKHKNSPKKLEDMHHRLQSLTEEKTKQAEDISRINQKQQILQKQKESLMVKKKKVPTATLR